jgi:hypothetical protein
MRQGEYKLIVPHSHDTDLPWGNYLDRVALYNVIQDSDESTNLADDSQHESRLGQMRKRLEKWWTPGDDTAVPKPDSTPE